MALRFEQKLKIWKEKYGDFSPEVKAMLKTLVDDISKSKAQEPCTLKKILKKGITKSGSFIREYNGRAHEVIVKGEKEFIYDGETYTSLSAIAFSYITLKHILMIKKPIKRQCFMMFKGKLYNKFSL